MGGRWIIRRSNLPRHHERCTGPLFDPERTARSRCVFRGHQGHPYLSPEYTYDQFAHVRLARLPLDGLHLRTLLDRVYPGWDEAADWSLLLERESFFYLVLSAVAAIFFLLVRAILAWYADRLLRIPRFHLREHATRAGAAFFSAPEIKQ